MNFNDLTMYLPASTPHLIALWCAQFPFVLSEQQIHENDYKLYPLTQKDLEKHCTFSMKNWNENRHYTLLTYSLVHYNLTHFYNNFISIVFCGTHIIKHTGGIVFWLTTLSGSIFGGLASVIEYNYHNSQSRLQTTIEKDSQSLWNKLTEPMKNYGNKMIDKSFDIINESRGMVGCSSSVYALYAFDFALTIDLSKQRFAKLWRKFINGDNTVVITQQEKLYALFDLLSLYSSIKRIQSDLKYLIDDKLNRSKIDHLIVASPDNIAHASHTGGFVAGLIAFTFWKTYQKYKYYNRYNVYRNFDNNDI
eukprot:359089_1